MIVSFFVIAVVIALSIPSAIIFLPLAAITGNPRPLYNVVCFIVRVAFRAAGIRVRVEGLQNVPEGEACIFMANHVSNLDPPGLIPRIPGRTAAFTKREVFKLPLFGLALKLGEFIPSIAKAMQPPPRPAWARPSACLPREFTSQHSSREPVRKTDA